MLAGYLIFWSKTFLKCKPFNRALLIVGDYDAGYGPMRAWISGFSESIWHINIHSLKLCHFCAGWGATSSGGSTATILQVAPTLTTAKNECNPWGNKTNRRMALLRIVSVFNIKMLNKCFLTNSTGLNPQIEQIIGRPIPISAFMMRQMARWPTCVKAIAEVRQFNSKIYI